jgi:hypothetical protein
MDVDPAAARLVGYASDWTRTGRRGRLVHEHRLPQAGPRRGRRATAKSICTVTIVGGSGGIRDLAGGRLTTTTWTFTTG